METYQIALQLMREYDDLGYVSNLQLDSTGAVLFVSGTEGQDDNFLVEEFASLDDVVPYLRELIATA